MRHPDFADLPARTRPFVVLIALLQGLLLYLAETGREHAWPLFDVLGGRVCWYALVLTVPTMMSLSVLDLRDRRFWQHSLAAAVVFLLLAVWAAWSATGAPGLVSDRVLLPFGLSMALGLFVALPYLQCRLQDHGWRAPYPALFEHAWQNALTIALAALFVGICWAVLVLWGELFALLRIRFFRDLFREEAFAYLATGLMAGLGILIGRTQHRPVRIARQIVFAIFTGLLPLLALILLMFVASLPFTGLDALWNTRSAAALLICVQALMLVFLNAVWQSGEQAPPYPAWLRRGISLSLLVLPVYAVLALYAVWLRIDQYGWTAERVWGAVLALVLAGYSLGYAFAALRRGGTWLYPLPRINVILSLVVLAVIALVNSPLADPHRLSVRDQVARLQDGRTPAERSDFVYLRFHAGRLGYRAALALRDDPLVRRNPRLRAELDRVIARTTPYEQFRSDEELRRSAVRSVDDARRLLVAAPGTGTLDPAWVTALVAQRLPGGRCLQPDADCVVLSRDLDGDGTAEYLLCDLGMSWGATCQVHTRKSAGWTHVGTVTLHGPQDRLDAPLRAGRMQTEHRRWADVVVDGQRSEVNVHAP